MRRITILNPKGGSGKTTLATNLAAYYASRGLATTLMDFDPQGSTARWLRSRPASLPAIHGIAAYRRAPGVTRSFQLRTPIGTDRVVVDTPAAIEPQRFAEFCRDADAIVVPVLPSQIDIHACAHCIEHLLTTAKIKRREDRIAVVANRVRPNTLVFRSLSRFLETLDIPFVATLRESQNYIRSFELGIGLHEMRAERSLPDIEQWAPLASWIESRGPARRSASREQPEAMPQQGEQVVEVVEELEQAFHRTWGGRRLAQP
jgi:chromosome partitioning protein